MDARELRIGNYVRHKTYNDNYIVKITCFIGRIEFESNDGYNDNYHDIDDFEPIPLTEEWLVKFGGEIEGNGYNNICVKFNNNCALSLRSSGFIMWTSNHAPMSWFEHVKSVHSLQNLYYTLTGEELVIK